VLNGGQPYLANILRARSSSLELVQGTLAALEYLMITGGIDTFAYDFDKIVNPDI